MAGSRTLKLSILADVSNLSKNLNTSSKEVDSFGTKVSDFSKKAGIAFGVAATAAAAYAATLLVDGVKSAIEDEAAQKKLTATLQNVTGATQDQIKATEDYISKTSLANGITDDELRPSLDRLVRATKDVTEAQKLQQIALDVSAGSGKSLEAVTNAMAKAAEGNTAALGKLGVGIDSATLKTMTMDEVTQALATTFGGQAATKADTFQGKMDRIKVAFDEAKESLGAVLLPYLERFVNYIAEEIVPNINKWIEANGPKIEKMIQNVIPKIQNLLDKMGEIGKWAVDHIDVLEAVAAAVTGFIVAAKAYAVLTGFVTAIKGVATAFGLVRTAAAGAAIAEAAASGGSMVPAMITGMALAAGALAAYAITSGGDGLPTKLDAVGTKWSLKDNVGGGNPAQGWSASLPKRATGGPVGAGSAYMVGERGPEMFIPRHSGTIIPNGGGNPVFNITVHGAVDAEGTARSIYNVIAQSAGRTGNYATLGIARTGLPQATI